eukprot:TRINITY_DN860_c0_g3_i1.p1 TRINITY_DN860_c0_g3~~TRINITY_DN860_c0_g3_i1.p1  ORF type:complete len:841 (+),score=146.96 TRINITY_DN860_c0_g3_i1:18-2540(+)
MLISSHRASVVTCAIALWVLEAVAAAPPGGAADGGSEGDTLVKPGHPWLFFALGGGIICGLCCCVAAGTILHRHSKQQQEDEGRTPGQTDTRSLTSAAIGIAGQANPSSGQSRQYHPVASEDEQLVSKSQRGGDCYLPPGATDVEDPAIEMSPVEEDPDNTPGGDGDRTSDSRGSGSPINAGTGAQGCSEIVPFGIALPETVQSSGTDPHVSYDPDMGPKDQSFLDVTEISQLGRGSFGAVYSAVVNQDNRQIAMKVCTGLTREVALRTAEVLQALKELLPHPNLVDVYDMQYFPRVGRMHVFMELVDGKDLSEYLRSRPQNDPLPERDAARLMKQVLQGMLHLHQHNFVHRDIKAQNILLTSDIHTAKLCDYGTLKELLASTVKDSCKSTTGVDSYAGSPNWVAPEVGTRLYPVGREADIYSFGCTLSEVLNRGIPPGEQQEPWEGQWEALCRAKVGLPENLAPASSMARAVFKACLAYAPYDRPTVEELLCNPFFSGAAHTGVSDDDPRGTQVSGSVQSSRFQSVQSVFTAEKPLTASQMAGSTVFAHLGEGTFGTVCKALLVDTGRIVAVKQIAWQTGESKQEEQRQQCVREVSIMQGLAHRNIVQYLGHRWVGPEGSGVLEIFMECVEGASTIKQLTKGGPPLPEVMCIYLGQILDGLVYLHKTNPRGAIAHRDIKGENLMVDDQGVVKLADFGCSKREVELRCESHANMLVGTPNWMAPEVVRSGSYDTKCDIWSLGCTIIDMMGTRPWPNLREESHQIIMQQVTSIIYDMAQKKGYSGVSPLLARFLSRCFIHDPSQRASASELLQHGYITGRYAALPDDDDDAPIGPPSPSAS